MSVYEQLALGGQSLLWTLRELGRGRLWVPFLVPFALQVLVVTLLAFAAHPALSWWMLPLLVRAAGADPLHYPAYFARLPDLALGLDPLIGATAGALATAATTRMFARVFERRTPSLSEAVGETLRRAVPFVIAQLPVTLILFVLGVGADVVAGSRISSITRALVPGAQTAAAIVVQAFFAYTVPLVVLGRRGPLAAWAALPRLLWRGFVPALIVFAVATALLVPFQFVLAQRVVLVARGFPELTLAATIALEAGAMAVSWLATGALTLVWMSALSSREEHA